MPESSPLPTLPDFRALFESAPGLYLVLTPEFTIVAVSDAYLRATKTKRDEIVGRGLFEVFPDNPNDPAATGTRNLRASLERVLQHRKPDTMAVQKYDIRRPASEGGGFEERYWSPVNSPVLGPDGAVAFILHSAEDVTKELAAKAERDRFFELSLDMMCIASADGYFKRLNPAFTQTLGWSVAEMLARPFLEFVHPDDHAATRREVERQVVAGEKVLRFLNRYRHQDGSWRWLSWKSAPQPGGLMYATARDITELRQAEEALRRSEESLSVTLNSIGDAVLATDTGGRVTRLNPVAERLTGWPQAEALGRPVAEVFHIINETTRAPGVIPVDKVLATGEIHGLANHTILIARDGAERPIADSAAPIRDREGRTIGVVLVFRDVSQDRKTEQELARFNEGLVQLVEERSAALQESVRLGHAALDALTAHVAILDERGVILATNRAWRNFAAQNGLPTAPVSEGTNYLTACDEAAAQSVTEAAQMAQGLRQVIAGEKPEFFLEYPCHTPTEQCWFLCRVTRFASGGPVRLVVAHENITQMKLLLKQQHRAQRLESIGTLTGGIAHDLNNALAPIMMGVELLKMEYPQETKVIEMIESSTKRGADMVRQLLNFAKGAEGERVSVRPERLITEMKNMMKGSFPKNIQVVVKCDPKLPTVLGDATQLHQVLLNLCVNARDAMPHGGTLTLLAQTREVDAVYASSVPDAKPGRYIALRVRDTGAGIPPEILDRIFDPFFTTKGPDKGTGLGLSTVMGIVKGHGGFLQVYSQPGQGSTFSVYLPVDRTPGDTELIPKAVVEFRGQEETILLVDDEPAVRVMSRAVLRRLNFKPLTATDGADGLMQVAEHRKELRAVITDLHMPHMDGLAFVRALRRMLPEVPVVVASGRMEEAVAAEFKSLGVTSRLDKPFTEAQLAEALRKLLSDG
jgi:two-component system cell cycle sensor histidine kinase/response regulator CckA